MSTARLCRIIDLLAGATGWLALTMAGALAGAYVGYKLMDALLNAMAH